MQQSLATAVARQSHQPVDPDISPQQAVRPVDLVHLSRYTLGEEKLEREVLQLFCVQAQQYLDRLEQATDADSWRHAAHTIKGSARGIGAWAVASAAQCAEELSNPPRGKGTKAAAKKLRAAVDSAIGFIDALLAER